eukprot:jgi/Ulvmu1/4940/UM205_0002.1
MTCRAAIDSQNKSFNLLRLYHTFVSLAFLCSSCSGQRHEVQSLAANSYRALSAVQHRWAGNQWLRAHEAGHIPEPPDLEERVMNPPQNPSVAMCAAMKSENMTDVREWLLYYRWLGVDQVYLNENSDKPMPSTTKQLQDFVDEGFVTYSREARANSQLKIYYDCLSKHAHKHDWMAFFDMDEYVVLMDRPELKLPDFLRAYAAYPGLVVHWVFFGPSGRKTRPRSGGVLRSYTKCTGRGTRGLKTIVNTLFVANIAPHPHNFEFRDGMPPVDENFKPIAHKPPTNTGRMCSPIPPARSAPGTAASALTAALPYKFAALDYTVDSRGHYCYARPGSGGGKAGASIEKIALFHYVTKSPVDFEAKVARGSGGGGGKKWTYFYDVERRTKKTGGICAQAADLAKECCPKEQFVAHASSNRGNVGRNTRSYGDTGSSSDPRLWRPTTQ